MGIKIAFTIVMIWMWGVLQKLTCEMMQEGSEEKWLGCKSLNPISELIPDGINWSSRVWLEEIGIGCGFEVCILNLEYRVPLSLCFLMMWAVSICHILLPWCSASPQALRNGASLLWTRTSETVSPQINLYSSIIVLVRSFSHSSK